MDCTCYFSNSTGFSFHSSGSTQLITQYLIRKQFARKNKIKKQLVVLTSTEKTHNFIPTMTDTQHLSSTQSGLLSLKIERLCMD